MSAYLPSVQKWRNMYCSLEITLNMSSTSSNRKVPVRYRCNYCLLDRRSFCFGLASLHLVQHLSPHQQLRKENGTDYHMYSRCFVRTFLSFYTQSFISIRLISTILRVRIRFFEETVGDLSFFFYRCVQSGTVALRVLNYGCFVILSGHIN